MRTTIYPGRRPKGNNRKDAWDHVNDMFADTYVSAKISGATRSNTNRWRAARGKVRDGIQNARILSTGNSITVGFDATGIGGGNLAAHAYPTHLAKILSSMGLNASWQNWIGGQNLADFAGNDSRLTVGSWTSAGLGTFGGNVMEISAAGTPMSFTPVASVDTVEVLGLRNSNAVRITVAVDGGGTLSTYNPFASGTGAIGISAPIALGSLAAHAIQANVSASQQSFLGGMIAYNSAVKEVSVLRAGWQGATAASFSTTPWLYTDGIKAVAPDLTLIAVTRNDIGMATDLATFTALYQNIVTAALLSGDVFVVIEPLGNLSAGASAPYVNALYALGLPVIDFTQLWDVYANTVSWYADTIHPFGFAYADMAQQIAAALLSV